MYLIEDEINSLITNKIRLKNLKAFSFIIGANPSKGARSPLLWNKVYDAVGQRATMIPLDVKEKNLEKLISVLQNEPACLGGAVAVPYKEKVFTLLSNNCTETIKKIGAINCIFRSAPNDKVFSYMLIFSFLSMLSVFGYSFYIFSRWLIQEQIQEGFTTVVILISLFGFLAIFFNSLNLIYLSRILNETKKTQDNIIDEIIE